jgi:hypothetical protein
MITYADHKKVMSNSENIEGWLLSLDEFEQGVWASKIQAGYPLREPEPIQGIFEHIDIEKMIFGQFIMIESAITSSLEFRDKVDMVLPLILRPHATKFDNDNASQESALVELIQSSDASYIEDVVTRFLDARASVIHEKYAGVFYSPPREVGDDEEEDEGTDDVLDEEGEFNRDWYFYSVAKSFVGDDITRMNEAYELPMKIPEMIYRAKKNKIDETRARLANFNN